MWFFKQTQQTTQPIQQPQQEVQAAPVAPEVTDAAVPAAEWFRDVVQPLEERRPEPASEENYVKLLDEMGWWKDESVLP